MIYRNFEQLIALVRANSKATRTVAVVAAEDGHTLEAVGQAARDGIVAPLLIGHKNRILEQLTHLDEQIPNYSIIHAETFEDAALKAAAAVASGEAHFLMKGLIPTAELMKALLSDKGGFRTGSLLSHLSFVQIANYHKLVGLTDAALNIYPDLKQKRAILENAVATMTRMGFDTPKVAILAANEQVNSKMPETIDAAELKRLNQEGSVSGCIVEGPISYDLMMSRESAAIKGYESTVCGDVDLMVVPNISAGNILLKALRYSAQASSAGIVVGGRVPIVLTSRAVDVQDKYLPLVLAASATL